MNPDALRRKAARLLATNPRESIELFTSVLAAPSLSDSVRAYCRLFRGCAYFNLHQLGSADLDFEVAGQLASSANEPRIRFKASIYRVAVQIASGLTGDGRARLLAILEQDTSPEREIQAYEAEYWLAVASLDLGYTHESTEFFHRCANGARNVGCMVYKTKCMLGLAQCSMLTGDPTDAESRFRTTQSMADSVGLRSVVLDSVAWRALNMIECNRFADAKELLAEHAHETIVERTSLRMVFQILEATINALSNTTSTDSIEALLLKGTRTQLADYDMRKLYSRAVVIYLTASQQSERARRFLQDHVIDDFGKSAPLWVVLLIDLAKVDDDALKGAEALRKQMLKNAWEANTAVERLLGMIEHSEAECTRMAAELASVQLAVSDLPITSSHVNIPSRLEYVKAYMDRRDPGFERRLVLCEPSLSSQEIEVCILIHLGFSTKEIADALYITQRSVELHRFRLRKKFRLRPKESLHQFLSSVV